MASSFSFLSPAPAAAILHAGPYARVALPLPLRKAIQIKFKRELTRPCAFRYDEL